MIMELKWPHNHLYIYNMKYIRRLVTGVHGVGKSTFLKNNINDEFIVHSCSKLLNHEREKRIECISNNQKLLVEAVNNLSKDNNYIFDGHTILANNDGIELLQDEVFSAMRINEIELLIDSSDKIYNRLLKRDSKSEFSIDEIRMIQEQEILHCQNISDSLNIPFKIIDSSLKKEVMLHYLKIDSIYFNDIAENKKNFEIRLNDRNYKKDDIVILNEVVQGKKTGKKILKRISYLLEDFKPIKEINYVIFELNNI